MDLKNSLSGVVLLSLLSCNGQNNKTTESTAQTQNSQTQVNTSVNSENAAVNYDAKVVYSSPAAEPGAVKNQQTAQYSSTNTNTGTAKPSTPTPAKTNKNNTAGKTTVTAPVSGRGEGRIGLTFLKEGEKKYFEERQMSIHFKRITEDSRCPAGVNCIWEGVAVAEITFDGKEAAPVTVKLASNSGAGGNYQHTVQYNGFNISLKSVAPNAVENKASFKGNYEIGLLFESAKGKGYGVDPALIRTSAER